MAQTKEKVKVDTYKMLSEIQPYFIQPAVNKTFWIITVLCVVNIIISFCIISIILEILALMVWCSVALSRQESYLKSTEAQWELLREHGDMLEYDVELIEDGVEYINCRNHLDFITNYSDITHYVETKNYFVVFDKDWQYLAIPRESELVEEFKKRIKHAKKIRWILYW